MIGVREDLLRWTGLAAGGAAAVWVAGQGWLGLGPMLAPALLGVGAVLGALAADATAPAPSGAVRVAGLTPRRIRDFVPRRAAVVLLAFAGTLAVMLAVAAVVASPDDLGRAGRSFAYACGDVAGSRGPWPGSYYALPLAAVVGAATLGSLGALRRTARRPGVDDGRRRAGATRVVAAWGLLVTASLAGVSYTMSGALADLPCGDSALLDGVSLGLGAVAALSAIAALACGVTLCRRGGRDDR